jgi:uncharacterized membrane protein
MNLIHRSPSQKVISALADSAANLINKQPGKAALQTSGTKTWGATTIVTAVTLAAGAGYLLSTRLKRRGNGVAMESSPEIPARTDHDVQHAHDERARRNPFASTVRKYADKVVDVLRGEIEQDKVLMRQVREAVQRTLGKTPGVGITVNDGKALLHGHVPQEKHEQLVRAVETTPGVRDVSDMLVERDDDDPSLRATSHLSQVGGWKKVDLRQEHWSPATRMLTGFMGAVLIRGVARGSALGVLGGLLGSALLYRTATNKPIMRGVGRSVIDVHETIDIDAPVERVFGLFEAQENYPNFMRNVREVRREAGGRTHWVMSGPAGYTMEFDSTTTVHKPNELLGWRSIPGSGMEHSGVVRFEPLAGNGTRVEVNMSYSPPAGAVGHAIARAFSADAHSELREDLARIKSIAERWDAWKASVENGRPRAH